MHHVSFDDSAASTVIHDTDPGLYMYAFRLFLRLARLVHTLNILVYEPLTTLLCAVSLDVSRVQYPQLAARSVLRQNTPSLDSVLP
jgi:hypothetical protein